jgi:hypothetical protein
MCNMFPNIYFLSRVCSKIMKLITKLLFCADMSPHTESSAFIISSILVNMVVHLSALCKSDYLYKLL